MATTKLALYNKALRHLGERKLASLSENCEPRRVLDDIWDGEAVEYCLEQGLWRFARRTVEAEYAPSIEPSFGYSRAFSLPDDWVRPMEVCLDAYFRTPLEEYNIEAGYIYADHDTLYIGYVSKDTDYGKDYDLWPPTFTEWVGSWLASEACVRITGDTDRAEYLRRIQAHKLRDAQATDAMSSPTKDRPHGRYVSSRLGGRFGDRGSRSNLIG